MDMRSESPYANAIEAWLASNRQDKSSKPLKSNTLGNSFLNLR